MTPKIMIILGSGSDISIANKAMDMLDKHQHTGHLTLFVKS